MNECKSKFAPGPNGGFFCFECGWGGERLRQPPTHMKCRKEKNGVGIEFSKILKKLLDVEPELGCACGRMIRMMNQWGPACLEKENLDVILTTVMSEASRRGWRIQNVLPTHAIITYWVKSAVEAERKRLETVRRSSSDQPE